MNVKFNVIKFGIGGVALIGIIILIVLRLFFTSNAKNEDIDYDIRKNINIITNREKYLNDKSIIIGNNLKEIQNRILWYTNFRAR